MRTIALGAEGGVGQKSGDPPTAHRRPPHSGNFFMADEEFDLFGNPYVEKPNSRGRPAHIVTKKNRNRVSMLVALGWSNTRISAAMEVTLPTLHKYYFYELRQRGVARDKLDVRRLELAWELAEKGNVGAFKEFGKLLERNDRMEIEREMASAEKKHEQPETKERLGKKVMEAQRAIDADADLMAELEMEAQSHGYHS